MQPGKRTRMPPSPMCLKPVISPQSLGNLFADRKQAARAAQRGETCPLREQRLRCFPGFLGRQSEECGIEHVVEYADCVHQITDMVGVPLRKERRGALNEVLFRHTVPAQGHRTINRISLYLFEIALIVINFHDLRVQSCVLQGIAKAHEEPLTAPPCSPLEDSESNDRRCAASGSPSRPVRRNPAARTACPADEASIGSS